MLRCQWTAHILNFRFKAGTSRGVFTERESFFLRLTDGDRTGFGECAPLEGLSIDSMAGRLFKERIDTVIHELSRYPMPLSEGEVFQIAFELAAPFPSIRMGLETAMLDLLHGGIRKVFPGPFSKGETSIPINGLIWMGNKQEMTKRIDTKVDEGFRCIKIKIGTLDFEMELDILRYIQDKYYGKKLLIRVDANGAFQDHEIELILERLGAFPIQFIEQPIAAGNWKRMSELCKSTPVPIALDEELIGNGENKVELLESIKPQYVILKPTLLGGFRECIEWIKNAQQLDVEYVITSALESNVGLNAIAQFTAQVDNGMTHGLGTGQLYENNISSPLEIVNGRLHHNSEGAWDFGLLSGWKGGD